MPKPRTKANVFRVPVYDSQEWATMRSIDADTIKGMDIALAAKVDPQPPAAIKKKKRVELGGLVTSSHES